MNANARDTPKTHRTTPVVRPCRASVAVSTGGGLSDTGGLHRALDDAEAMKGIRQTADGDGALDDIDLVTGDLTRIKSQAQNRKAGKPKKLASREDGLLLRRRNIPPIILPGSGTRIECAGGR